MKSPPIFSRAGLLRYVRPQREDNHPAAAHELRLCLAAYIYGGKNQISNLALIYTFAEILLFLY